MFGRLASYIKHNLTIAHDLSDFATAMRHFLVNLNRSHEKQAVVRRMDSIRDWNAFLFPLLRAGRYLTGIGGGSGQDPARIWPGPGQDPARIWPGSG